LLPNASAKGILVLAFCPLGCDGREHTLYRAGVKAYFGHTKTIYCLKQMPG
jgi:hypothetical protein